MGLEEMPPMPREEGTEETGDESDVETGRPDDMDENSVEAGPEGMQ